ncbi:MAG: glycerol-3-phosphate 1-O-acyltransferase PlsY [Wenzhouxiangellaceae bacterium]|nr:glycerol-3-phosphate 1-O-acyltransferase PlsY [Wenzhouxiangellaceae bacterium]
MIDLAWMTVLAYLVGSVSGSLVLGRLRGVDIRAMGSGNAGGTNALRTVGWMFALGVVLIDIGKGVLAAALIPALPLVVHDLAPALAGADPVSHATRAAACGFAAVLGHVWPVYFGFRGGKGAGTAVGVVAVLAPWCLLPLLVVWLVTLLGTGFVGLATVLGGLTLAPSMWLIGPDPLPPAYGALAIALAALLVFTHRENLARLKSGTENRFEKVRVLRRGR